MKVEASVDIGSNLTSLLERLAQQIGTTVDKVYPWYVQQAYLEGVTTIVAILAFIVVCAVAFGFGLRWAMKAHDFHEGHAAACVIPAIALAATLLIAALEGTTAVRKIMNPNFYAMQMLTADIGRLTGK